jgi:hypothetical protein
MQLYFSHDGQVTVSMIIFKVLADLQKSGSNIINMTHDKSWIKHTKLY